MDIERTLGMLLGLHAAYLAHSTALSQEEVEYNHWLQSQFFAGGLQVLQPKNPFEEEKGESRTPSCTTTPGKADNRNNIQNCCIFLDCVASYILISMKLYILTSN